MSYGRPVGRSAVTSGISTVTDRSREIGVRSIHRWAAQRKGVNRTDVAAPLLETGRYEEADADHRTRPRSAAPRALRRDVRDRGRLMFPLAVAIPLSLLPIASLAATLRWMAVSSG